MSSPTPIRIAIVGAGPSGFFAAGELFHQLGDRVRVDMIERLPVPYGLVRFGVAPDHQRTKRVIAHFERIARHERFAFLGNVEVGRDVTPDELRNHYDAVIFATGAETNRDMGVPGEELPGFHHAIDLVAWYNGHPDYQDLSFDFSRERAVIIGNGNVALDIARVLAKSPDELRSTDITQRALEALSESRIREILVVGRRGPAQTSFTEPEITEFASLHEYVPMAHPEELVLNPESEQECTAPHADIRVRILDILRSFADGNHGNKKKRVIFRFLRSPAQITGRERVEGIRLVENRLEGRPHEQYDVPTANQEIMPCGMVISSIGYRGLPIAGLPFDESRGVLPQRAGRLIRDGEPMAGFYSTGWIKRGSRGLIGHNKPDAVETIHSIAEDLPNLARHGGPVGSEGADLHDLLKSRGVRVVNYEQWLMIDRAEVARGRRIGKPREKFTTVDEMLAAARV